MLSLVLLMVTSVELWPGFVNEIEVEGSRTRREARAVLSSATFLLDRCIQKEAAIEGFLMIDMEVLAAGYVDQVLVLERHESDSVLDEDCVLGVLRSLPFRDRGKEAPSHMVLRIPVVPTGELPPAGVAPTDIARALEIYLDDLGRCTHQSGLEGTTSVVRFFVDKDGRVAAIDDDDLAFSSDVARACVVNTFRRLRFSSGREHDLRVAWPVRVEGPHTPRGRVSHPRTFFEYLGCATAFSLPRGWR